MIAAVTADQAVPPYLPHVSGPGDGLDRRFGDRLFAIECSLGLLATAKQRLQLPIREPDERQIESFALELAQLRGESGLIPPGALGQAVIGDLCCAQHNAEHF
jgi:hypothetical protein